MSPSEALRVKNSQIEKISKFFNRGTIEKIARETKFVQRESPLSGLDFLLLCVFAHQQCTAISLEGMCAELLKSGISITKQSLQERFNTHSVSFMERILNEALSTRLNTRAITPHPVFDRIAIWDSTGIELPGLFCEKYRGSGGGASQAALKLQYGYDLLSQKIIAILVQQGIHPDNRQELAGLKANDLRIEDLGYFKLNRLEQIAKAGAFFLSRYKFGVVVYTLENRQYQQLDLLKLQNKMRPGERKTLEAFIGKLDKMPVRLIIEKIPQGIADEKRRRLKTDKQIKRRSISKNRLKLCNLNIYISNTNEQQIPSEHIRSYYSLRWQIEIIFKAWKSVYNIDKIKTMRIQRFESMHYGALILIVLTTNLLSFYKRHIYANYKQEVSELKFYLIVKSMLFLFKQTITHSRKKMLEFLNLLEQIVHRTGIKGRKKNKSTPFHVLAVYP